MIWWLPNYSSCVQTNLGKEHTSYWAQTSDKVRMFVLILSYMWKNEWASVSPNTKSAFWLKLNLFYKCVEKIHFLFNNQKDNQKPDTHGGKELK